MGLLDRYRQFEDIDEREWNRGLRERRRRERALALQQVPPIDLSSTEWPELPDSEVMNAAIAAARGRVNGYPDRQATVVRRMLAERHGVEPEQVALGNGAAELLEGAARLLLGPGDELVTAWPSYPLYPIMAGRAAAQAVPVPLRDGRLDPEGVLERVTDRTRIVVVCNPNDPTGGYLEADALGGLLSALPEGVHLLLDEALVHFQDAEPPDAALRLVDAFPRLLVVRSFSKVYGLSGLRAGYAVGSRAALPLVEALGPLLGVNALTQAAVRHALRTGDAAVDRRRRMVIEQRARLEADLRELPVEASGSHANFIWLRADGLTGGELAARLQGAKVIVAPGAPLGDDDHVRVSVRGPAASERLLAGLRQALEHPSSPS